MSAWQAPGDMGKVSCQVGLSTIFMNNANFELKIVLVWLTLFLSPTVDTFWVNHFRYWELVKRKTSKWVRMVLWCCIVATYLYQHWTIGSRSYALCALCALFYYPTYILLWIYKQVKLLEHCVCVKLLSYNHSTTLALLWPPNGFVMDAARNFLVWLH